ncbi:SDR family oxidoreductase [bacterium]|nr:SDR family oxidoreductase [bacterium]
MTHLLITGGTSGIGLNFVERYSKDFDEITVLGRDFSKLDQLNLNFNKQEVDFSSHHGNYEFIDGIGIITHAVFAAGYVENTPLRFHESESATRQIMVNLVSQVNLFAELYRCKRLAQNGSVVFVGSLLGPSIGMPAGLSYAASKAGLMGAIKVMALEAAKKGIRVNAVSPGMVETPMTESLVISSELIKKDKRRYPLGAKYLKQDEVTSIMKFLLDSGSNAITGQNIVADRGFTLQ